MEREMRDIWVTSDTHFGHANILSFKDADGQPVRPGFASVDDMNQTMVDRWNSVVRPGDIVYHLGDVMFGDKTAFQSLWARLHGRKRLVIGNHDDVPYLSSGGFFQKMMLWRLWPEFNLLLTHVPVHPSTLGESRFRDSPMLNVHGHIHQNASPPGPYRCVCVEQTDYTPVHIDTLRVH